MDGGVNGSGDGGVNGGVHGSENGNENDSVDGGLIRDEAGGVIVGSHLSWAPSLALNTSLFHLILAQA